MKAKRPVKNRGKGLNFSLILWLSFSLFATLLITVFSIVQNVSAGDHYREEIAGELRMTGDKLLADVNGVEDVENAIHIVVVTSELNGVSSHLYRADGEEVFPESGVDAKKVAYFEEILSEGRGDTAVFTNDTGNICYLGKLSSGGYLYIVHSLKPVESYMGDSFVRSMLMVTFAIVLAFIVSGFVAVAITRPITDVTEKAKELAKGNYNVHFRDERVSCTEVNDLSDALDFARAEISKADNMQKELIANISHDFKTPLTMIKAYASMIQEISGDDPEKRTKHTQVILDESERLTALVGDLLDLSRIRSGIAELKISVFNLSEFVFQSVERFRSVTSEKGYTIETEVEDDLYTEADRDKIGQVLYNLIGNAVNYTGDDKRVVVKLYEKGPVIRFEVIDSGKGIPEEEICTVWDRYYRSEDTHRRPVKGTGLGLSIVKTILDRHGLRFGILSKVGSGSCFWVEFTKPKDEIKTPEASKKKRKKKK